MNIIVILSAVPDCRRMTIKYGQKKHMAEINKQELEEKVIEVLKSCYDPEIPVDIFELGLIYEVGIDNDAKVDIKMTLTSPACPVAGSLPPEVEMKVLSIPEVKDAKVKIVWSPPWDKDMMSDEAKVKLGMY
jgi:FeS assembly SUF system protein